MFCSNCGKEFEGRSDAKYCSNTCKQVAFKKRHAGNGLSDGVPMDRQMMVRPQQSSYITNQVTHSIVGGLTGGLSSGLSDGVNQLTNINNDFYQTLSMLAGSVLGGFIGYNFVDTKKKNDSWSKFLPAVIGVGVGFYGGQIIYNLCYQFNEYYTRKQEFLNNEIELQQKQLVALSDTQVYTSNDVKYRQIPTIKLDGKWSSFLGTDVNYGFLMFVYGGAGGGKSHFSTMFSSYLEKIGKVLYVLAEEGVTNSVQKRIERYNTQNTDYIETRSEQEILNRVGDYRFVVLDSINGMVNYNNHLEFIRKLKSNQNLYGIVIVNQVNKDGQFTGKNEVLHEVDIEISVENGIAETRKNRFDYSGKTMNIFSNNRTTTESMSNAFSVSNNGFLIGN